jgi:hypothetical protein
MPLYTHICMNGHSKDLFVRHPDDKGCDTHICKVCQGSLAPIISYGQGLCYFEEGRERRIWNLERADQKDAKGNPMASQPVFVRSAGEHKRKMREAGVDFANRGVGHKGQWI